MCGTPRGVHVTPNKLTKKNRSKPYLMWKYKKCCEIQEAMRASKSKVIKDYIVYNSNQDIKNSLQWY